MGKAGDPKTGQGCIRQVPGCIVEEILEAELGEFVEYRVKSGPFPVSYHRGKVDFLEAPNGETTVVWSVNFTPYRCCGPLVSGIIHLMFPIVLGTLAKAACKRSKL